MEEKKTTKKTTTTKKATSTKAKTTTTKKKVQSKEEVVEQLRVQAQPSMEQMFQMFQMFMNQQIQQQPQSKNVEEKKVVNKRTNNKLNKSTLRREGDEDVLVRSVVGCVCFKSPKTGITYNFTEIGDEEWMSIDEVLQMETASRKYLHTPWLAVEDDEVNEVLGLKEVTETIDELTTNLDEVLEEYDI